MRYDTRRDRRGWTVFDRWTGQVVVWAHSLQSGLTGPQADAMVDRLTRDSVAGDRNIRQRAATGQPWFPLKRQTSNSES